jgi:two-component system, OmpR family, sensor histidine kinase KdpD
VGNRSAALTTYLRSEDLLADPVRAERPPAGGLGRRRQVAGVVVAVFALALLTLALDNLRDALSLESQVLLYLLAVVAVAVVGGMVVALSSAIAAAFLINYFFVKPVHTLDVAQGEQALALLIFLVVAAVVSGAVELAARRGRAAEQAAREAETLSSLAGGELEESESLRGVLERARDTFGMESVALKVREAGDWRAVEEVGWAPPGEEAPLRFDVPIGHRLRLIGRGAALFAEDQRVLQAFAAAAQTALDAQRLSAKAREASELATADQQRTALLAAVGHDLRTPLAGIKASVSTLRQTDVDWSPHERDELLAMIEQSADRLDSIVANLLDASRLQAGALSVQSQPVALDEAIGAALLAVPGTAGRVTVDVPEDLPLVQADPGLLERVLANLLDNAVRYGSGDRPVEVIATAGGTTATLKVIDHGPGVPEAQRERMFQAFQRIDDRSAARGVGLGLSVARGFMEAMDGVLIADGSSGDGLTMRLRLPLAQ